MRRSPDAITKSTRSVVTPVVVGLMFVILAGAGLLYVRQVNKVATDGLTIRDLQTGIDNLRRETRELEIESATLRTLGTVEQASKELNLVVQAPTEYLPSVPESIVVVAR